MRILVTFNIEGKRIRQSLPVFDSRPIREQKEIDIVLSAYLKIGKNTRGWLELLSSIHFILFNY